jgi:hypothetical protein
MTEETNQETNLTDSVQPDSKINNVVALTQLVGTIVDYYSFKSKLIEDEDETDKWKKGSNSEEPPVIPSKIDVMIEKSFTHQLKKFTE